MNWICSLLVAHLAQSPSPVELPSLQLVESVPVETTLGHPEVPDARETWPAMIAGAREELCFAQFYASGQPGSALDPTLAAIRAAAERGVRVRFLLDQRFRATYPEIPAELAKLPRTEVRFLDLKPHTGGVLHAKYFLVDAREAFVGSQNFDWRSLEHIQELGLRVRDERLCRQLKSYFELDWALAGGARPELPARTEQPAPAATEVELVGSPQSLLPAGASWDLPRILALIAGAKQSVRVQLLTYKMTTRDDGFWPELEAALRGAAARGVQVELLLADWCQRAGTIEGLQALEPLENVAVRLVTIPPWSGGFVPFARVVHAKYLVVDGAAAWLGTSNWERNYFHASRNVGFVIHGGALPGELERFFAAGWGSPYAKPVDPCARYTAPRIDK